MRRHGSTLSSPNELIRSILQLTNFIFQGLHLTPKGVLCFLQIWNLLEQLVWVSSCFFWFLQSCFFGFNLIFHVFQAGFVHVDLRLEYSDLGAGFFRENRARLFVFFLLCSFLELLSPFLCFGSPFRVVFSSFPFTISLLFPTFETTFDVFHFYLQRLYLAFLFGRFLG